MRYYTNSDLKSLNDWDIRLTTCSMIPSWSEEYRFYPFPIFNSLLMSWSESDQSISDTAGVKSNFSWCAQAHKSRAISGSLIRNCLHAHQLYIAYQNKLHAQTFFVFLINEKFGRRNMTQIGRLHQHPKCTRPLSLVVSRCDFSIQNTVLLVSMSMCDVTVCSSANHNVFAFTPLVQ